MPFNPKSELVPTVAEVRNKISLTDNNALTESKVQSSLLMYCTLSLFPDTQTPRHPSQQFNPIMDRLYVRILSAELLYRSIRYEPV
jgi:hypothetical protein